MNVAYYFKEQCETIEDAISCHVKNAHLIAEEAIAVHAAEHAWNHDDGWEWMNFGCVMSLVIDGKDVGDFKITVEEVPEFWARKL